MKAVRIHEFGGPEVLKLDDIERPVPVADEILVKVFASGVNPVDWVVRQGGNNFLRPALKLPLTLGWDTAGIVEEIGSNVTGFKKGDEVYGVPNFPGNGSYAGYVAAKANQFALKPQSITFNEAAGIPLTGLVACNALFELGKLQAGQRIFIHGASGGVGSLAVQLAKAKGAYVIGCASTRNQEFLKQLGADEVIDYKTQQFDSLLQDMDVVFDSSPLRDDTERLKGIRILKNGGIFVSVNIDFPFSDAVKEALVQKNAKGELLHLQTNHQYWLTEMARLVDENKLKVIISKVYPLEQVAEAHKESATWHVRGKLVLEVRKEKQPLKNGKMKIIVTGSLGNISKPLVTELSSKGHSVTVISSKSDKQKDIENIGAKAAIGSIEDLAFLTATFTGADAVYCMIPFSFTAIKQDEYFQKIAENYVQAIKAAGIKKVVILSGWAADVVSLFDINEIFNDLSGIAVTELRPGPFYSNFYGNIKMIKEYGAIMAGYGGEDKIAFVSPTDIATAAEEALTTPFQGKRIRYVASDELTCNEAARILGEAIGKPDLKWITLPEEQVLNGLLQSGISPQLAADLVEMQMVIHSGIVYESYLRNKPVLGKTKLKDFATDFAAMYHQ